MANRRQERRGTTAQWAASIVPLLDGEIGIEICTDGLRKSKIGDGSSLWAQLAYQSTLSANSVGTPNLQDLAVSIRKNSPQPKTILNKLASNLSVSTPVVVDYTGGAPTAVAISSTFRGWATRLSYGGEVYRAINVYLNLEVGNNDVSCSICDDNMNVLATVTQTVLNAGGQWVLFIFDTDVTSSLITGANYYVAVQTVANTGCRMQRGTYPAYGTSKCTANSTGNGNKYITTGSTTWVDCLAANSLQIEFYTYANITVMAAISAAQQASMLAGIFPINSLAKISLITPGNNIFDATTITSNYYVSPTTGLLVSSSQFYTSDFIVVLANTNYTIGLCWYIAYYDANQNFISGAALNPQGQKTITTPSNCAFMRFSYWTTTAGFQNTLMVNAGSSLLPYETYYYKFSRSSGGLSNNYTNFLVLPASIKALIGYEINIYFDNIILDNATDYFIDVTCSIGTQENERWTCVPTTAGTYSLTIDLYKNNVKVATATTSIIVTAATTGNGITRKAIFIGDSTTMANPSYINQLINRFSTDVMKVTLYGTVGTTPNFNEGRTGWTAAFYTGLASSGGVTNAFWNSGTSVFDFSYYMAQQGYPAPDYVGIHLGINDLFSYTDDASLLAGITATLANFQTMITSTHTYNSSIKIALLITIPPSFYQDAFGLSYQCGQTRWRYKRNNLIWMQALINQYSGQESNKIYLVPINVNLDTVDNMNFAASAPVNARNSALITRQNNSVHPALSGYDQMADEIYYWLKSFES